MSHNNNVNHGGTQQVLIPIVESTEILLNPMTEKLHELNSVIATTMQLPASEWPDDRRIRICLTYTIVPQVEILIEKN